jgi:hypothetical protein
VGEGLLMRALDVQDRGAVAVPWTIAQVDQEAANCFFDKCGLANAKVGSSQMQILNITRLKKQHRYNE